MLSSYEKYNKVILNQIDNFSSEKVSPETNLTESETIGLIIKPDKEICKQIEIITAILKGQDSQQYYYNEHNLHFTLIGGFPTDKINQNTINELESYFKGLDLEIHYRMLSSNKYTSAILVFPTNFSLHDIREDIRNVIGNSGTDYKKHLDVYENVGWVNFVRYLNVPTESLVSTIKKHKNCDIGTQKIKSINMSKTSSKILDEKNTRTLKVFNLQKS